MSDEKPSSTLLAACGKLPIHSFQRKVSARVHAAGILDDFDTIPTRRPSTSAPEPRIVNGDEDDVEGFQDRFGVPNLIKLGAFLDGMRPSMSWSRSGQELAIHLLEWMQANGWSMTCDHLPDDFGDDD